MAPNYVAKKTCLAALTPLRILFFWLIIPTVLIIADIIKLKNDVIEFYDDYVLVKSGVLSKKQRRTLFSGVYSVSVDQNVFGRMFNYGDVQVDVPGKWDINTKGVKAPNELSAFLESKITARGSVTVLEN